MEHLKDSKMNFINIGWEISNFFIEIILKKILLFSHTHDTRWNMMMFVQIKVKLMPVRLIEETSRNAG